MTIVPAFEAGVWNAWIFTTILFLFIMVAGTLPKDIGKKITPVEEVSKIRNAMIIIFFSMIIYSVFLPLKLGTAWFYAGLAVYLSGFVTSIAALFSIASAKLGEPFTTGVYRYSRHPLSLGTLLPFLGVGIATASWLFLLLCAILAVISHFFAVIEEGATSQKLGKAYIKYMSKTPRWIGFPKA